MAFRASPSRVRTTVHSARIAAAFLPGGMVWDNMRRLQATNVALARLDAPVRTSALKRSIGGVLTPAGRFHARYTVFADAKHAKFVIGGTRAYIMSTRRFGNMVVRPAPSSYYTRPTLRKVVRGQKANDFLTRSMRRTLRMHGVG